MADETHSAPPVSTALVAPSASDGSRFSMSLGDRYSAESGWVYMTGTQALVRLALQQRLRDQAEGKNTGGYISGYRGSPLGRFDMELWAANHLLKENNIVFRSGLNEDLAATALWGSQYVGLFQGATVQGVFGIWYGKGPGVDRSMDVLRHSNYAGTSPLGGVVALAGDDHGVKSSTVANFSDQMFIAAGIPVLYPSNTQELIDFGLHGIAMSRFSGCWTGMKVVTDVVEGGGSVYVAPDSPVIHLPTDYKMPSGGVNIRAIDAGVPQEDRLYHHKIHAALAYVRANDINRITIDSSSARIGIVSAGKAYQDVEQALAGLGLDDERAAQMGLRVLKMGMVWPVDPEIIRQFARGLTTIIVVEEKRPVMEDQIRAILYGGEATPAIIGKHAGAYGFDDNRGPIIFPNSGETSPTMVANVLVGLLTKANPQCGLNPPDQVASVKGRNATVPSRVPGFCSGCPHNRSTKVPEGSRALAGIGCHGMAWLIDPTKTTTMSHMGGEGVMWLGQQPFTTEKHVFANLGDGTFAHSGFLAVRQAVAAHVPITYKILHNGFVSMTGGQPVDGGLSPPAMLHGLAAEGVGKLALVTDEPEKYSLSMLPAGATLHHRSEMETVQKDFRDYPDVSVIVYDQPCATERRRLRKRGKWVDPQKRTFINSAVCEGCGDCGTVSNCMSIEPLETEFGRKRKINQSSCNKDFTCTEGFCPSFVTVHGGELRKPDKKQRPQTAADSLTPPEPVIPAFDKSFAVLIGGIGGTGVVTIGQTLAVAAHIDGYCSSNLDVTGLSQKYGAVLSHVKFAREQKDLHATRIAEGEADTLIGCDLIVAAGDEARTRTKPGKTRGVISTDLIVTSEFSRNPDWNADEAGLIDNIRGIMGENALFLPGLKIANALMGDAIAANMFTLGAAWQLGQIPLTLAAINRAIELNGVQIAMNREAFLWGRRAAYDLAAVEKAVQAATGADIIALADRKPPTVQELVDRRVVVLTDYQDSAYAVRYASLVEKVRIAEIKAGLNDQVSQAVAQSYFKLLAVKDEWEVARLYAHPDFKRDLEQTFAGDYKLHFHIGAWPFATTDATGKIAKREIGPWMLKVLAVMAKFRSLRGSWMDPFKASAERRLANELIATYEADIALLLPRLDAASVDVAAKIASLPQKIRGYGHIREASAATAMKEREALLKKLTPVAIAAE